MLAFTLSCAGTALAQTETVLYNYTAKPNTGLWPSSVAFDSAGNMYGTNEIFGSGKCASGCGSVFELSPNGSGGVSYSVIYAFKGGTDGATPEGVVFGPDGSLYGVTYAGGPSKLCADQGGCGTVYKLTKNTSGVWSETQLYAFGASQQDGENPSSPIAFDAQGNIYGTTLYGAASFAGILFRLSPNADGSYTETTLYPFTGGTNGNPDDLIQDAKGNLYVATTGLDLGDPGQGAVEKIAPDANGNWKPTALHTFDRGEVYGLAIDPSGNIFGLLSGAKFCIECGTAFELSPSGKGYTKTEIASFTNATTQGSGPSGGLTLDASGKLYGVTVAGGIDGYGVVFKLTKSGGKWKETVLHNFTNGSDGGNPYSGVVFDTEGNLYGSTFYGGSNDQGVLFKLQP